MEPGKILALPERAVRDGGDTDAGRVKRPPRSPVTQRFESTVTL